MQYFVAGILPTIQIILLYFVLKGIFKLREIVDKKIWNDEIRRQKYSVINTGPSYLLILLITMDLIFGIELPILVYFFVFALIVMSFLFSPKVSMFNRKKNLSFLKSISHIIDNFRSSFARVYGSLMAVLIVIVVTYYSFEFFYRYYLLLPQEFGGVEPKTAILELDRTKFSAITFQVFTGSTDSLIKVASSKTVNVYYFNERILMFKVSEDDTVRTANVYQILFTNVNAIQWIDE